MTVISKSKKRAHHGTRKAAHHSRSKRNRRVSRAKRQNSQTAIQQVALDSLNGNSKEHTTTSRTKRRGGKHLKRRDPYTTSTDFMFRRLFGTATLALLIITIALFVASYQSQPLANHATPDSRTPGRASAISVGPSTTRTADGLPVTLASQLFIDGDFGFTPAELMSHSWVYNAPASLTRLADLDLPGQSPDADVPTTEGPEETSTFIAVVGQPSVGNADNTGPVASDARSIDPEPPIKGGIIDATSDDELQLSAEVTSAKPPARTPANPDLSASPAVESQPDPAPEAQTAPEITDAPSEPEQTPAETGPTTASPEPATTVTEPDLAIAEEPEPVVEEPAPAAAEEPESVAEPEPTTGNYEEVPSYVREMMAKVVYREADCLNDLERSMVVWTILNRYDSGIKWFGKTIEGIITKPWQYAWDPNAPVTEANLYIVDDVIERWQREQQGETDVGRTLPIYVCYFEAEEGPGWHNRFYWLEDGLNGARHNFDRHNPPANPYED